MLRRIASIALFAASAVAQAANILTISGPQPFGFANQTILVQAWSQSASYNNVAITAPLEDNTTGGPIAGVEGTVYLTNMIGPGTTAANNVAAPVSISGLTNAFTTRTLFSGLSLPPGNYYLSFVAAHANPQPLTLSMSPEGSSTPAITVGTGVLAIGSDGEPTPAAFPPATAVMLNPPANLFITVTGDIGPTPPSASVPTLSLWSMAALIGLLALLALLARRPLR